MRMFVITKRTLFMAAIIIMAVILTIVLAVILSGSNTTSASPTMGNSDSITIDESYISNNINGLLSASEGYENEVLAGYHKELPIYSVDREDKSIALTIDAAWEDDKTPYILETLSMYNIKATFFLCGFWVEQYPDQVKAIYEAGHQIGNHSSTHPHMNQQSSEQILNELKEFDDLLESIIGVRSNIFRAPYGEYNDNVIKTVRNAGYEVIQWDIDTVDWKEERSSQTILDSVLPKLDPGSIILCHNNGFKIKEYLPTLIETALAQGYMFKTIDELLLEGETIIDVNGVQKLG